MPTDFRAKAFAAVSHDLNFRLNTLRVAKSQLGIHEEGGSNRGPAVEAFQREAGIRPGDPWCAAFVNWSARVVEQVLRYRSPLEGVPLQGYVQSYYEWAKGRGYLVEAKDVKPGDLFLLYFPSMGRYAHIGLVDVMGTAQFQTVEGNSNDSHSREGVKVCQNWRSVTAHVAFARWTRVVERL